MHEWSARMWPDCATLRKQAFQNGSPAKTFLLAERSAALSIRAFVAFWTPPAHSFRQGTPAKPRSLRGSPVVERHRRRSFGVLLL